MEKNRFNKNILYFISIVTNLFLFLSIILFVIYCIIPVIGGIFSSRAVVIYGSWIGIAFAIKYIINKIEKNIQLKWYEFLILFLYGTVCMFLWFSLPFNIVFSIFLAVANVVGYRAQIKSLKKEK